MMRAIILVLLLFFATQVAAQTLRIRSGEHADFSRVVIPLPKATEWVLTPLADDLRLETPQNQFTFDISEIFRRIPKTRLLDATITNGTLVLKTAAGVIASSQQLPNGTVVIDLRSGPLDRDTSVGKIGFPHYAEVMWRDQIPQSSGPPPTQDTQNMLHTERVSAAEQALWTSMTRAAAQGIISVDPLKKHTLNSADPPHNITGLSDTDIRFPFQMETVIDRDSRSFPPDPQYRSTKISCPDDRLFAIETWQNDAPFISQLAVAHTTLLGEFDRPHRDAVLTLARLYLSYGFGREAQATLAAFDIDDDDARAISFMASVIDELPQSMPRPYADTETCDGKVVLWSFLGISLPTTSTVPPPQVNIAAIQKAFSALPPTLRAVVGPELVTKLIAIGKSDAAEVILNAMQRSAAADGNVAVALARAQLLLTTDQPRAAQEVLRNVPKTNDMRALQSLILSVEAKLAQKIPIDDGTITDMAAQLPQTDHTEIEFKLRRALARAQASVGRFPAAFAVMRDWPSDTSSELFMKTWIDIGWMLAAVPDDAMFSSQMFDRTEDFKSRPFPQTLTLAMADRLAALGFRQAAEQMISERQRTTIEGRLSLALAALADRDASAALAHLQGLDGENALRLRAQSYKILGEHQNAAAIFQSLNDPTATAQEAWRGAAHDLVLEFGSDLQKAAYTITSPDTSQTGPLGQASELIRQSQQDREMLDALLAAP